MSIKNLANEIAATVDKKGAAYGNAIDFVEKTLTELYTNGIPVAAYKDALITIRVLDKLKRLSTDPNAFGESPWDDIVGYALRGAEKNRAQKQKFKDVFAGPPLYTMEAPEGWKYADPYGGLSGLNSVGRGEPVMSGTRLALMQQQAEEEYRQHQKLHNELVSDMVGATLSKFYKITDEDVDMAVDVLAEILTEPIEDSDLFDEIWYTFKDLGWSDIEIHDTAVCKLDVPLAI